MMNTELLQVSERLHFEIPFNNTEENYSIEPNVTKFRFHNETTQWVKKENLALNLIKNIHPVRNIATT